MKKYKVYWIRRTIHNDIFVDGYIGITSNIQQRWKMHKRLQSGNSHLERSLKLYNDIIFEELFEGTREHCEEIEFYLRPNKNMGWNFAEGGNIPPCTKGRKWTKTRRENYHKTVTEKNSNYRTPYQRQMQMQTRRANGYVEGKNLNIELIRNSLWWNDGTQNKRCKQSPGSSWVRGRLKFSHYGKTKICPHCKKQGKGAGMARFHFDNCTKSQT